jgi:transcriptional regulator with XRE-family HTH domain
MERHERGIDGISVEKLCAIAKALSVDITALLPGSTESYVENNSEGEKMLHLVKRYKKFGSRITQSVLSTNKSLVLKVFKLARVQLLMIQSL